MKNISTTRNNILMLLILVLSGVVIGGFIGDTLSSFYYFDWLSYGSEFGLLNPLLLELGVFSLEFSVTIRFTIAGIIGIIIAFLIYRRLY